MVHSVCKREKKQKTNIYIHTWEVTMQPLENYIVEYLMIWKNVCKINEWKISKSQSNMYYTKAIGQCFMQIKIAFSFCVLSGSYCCATNNYNFSGNYIYLVSLEWVWNPRSGFQAWCGMIFLLWVSKGCHQNISHSRFSFEAQDPLPSSFRLFAQFRCLWL